MVEGNSELFCIAWFCRRLYIHPGLFGGLKIVQFDWLLLKLINYSYGYKPIGVPHFDQLDVSWYPMKIYIKITRLVQKLMKTLIKKLEL